MPNKTNTLLRAALIAIFALIVATASTTHAGEAASSNEKPVIAEVGAKRWESKHRVDLGDRKMAYTATAGTVVLKDDEGTPIASVFYTAYMADDAGDPATRPITFAFNGGPGSSSVWLHLGTFGPKRVDFADAVQPSPPAYGFVDNPDGLLEVTDLVFIDPVGTGFSTPEGETEASEFFGLEADTEAVADFIYRFTSQNGRWNSPRFLAGESYGTTRAATVARYLQGRGMEFNGLILVSAALDFQTLDFNVGNDLPYITFLPTFAATAWYHDALASRPDDLDAFLEEVRRFAETDYAAALMQGDRLGPEESRRIAEALAHYTGLSPEFIEDANLRVSIFRFTKELLRDRRRTVGRLDSRYLGIDTDAAGESYEHDPSYSAILGPYTAALNDYLRRQLGVDLDQTYEILSSEINQSWDWRRGGGRSDGHINVAGDLSGAMSRNTHLKVLVANGYYDLATPFFAAEYTMHHLGLEPELRDNVRLTYDPAGHMMYVHPPSRRQLKEDIVSFIEWATSGDGYGE
jgi:carboxypeptidase C (cathepsin A)